MSDQFNMTDLLDEIESTPDLGYVPHNSESELEIVSVQRGPSKNNENNTDMLTFYIRSVTFEDTRAIPYWLVLPQPHHDAETRKRNNRGLKEFARAFSGLPLIMVGTGKFKNGKEIMADQNADKFKKFLGDFLNAIEVRSPDGESFTPNQDFFRGLRSWGRVDFEDVDTTNPDPKKRRTRAGNVIREFTRVSA